MLENTFQPPKKSVKISLPGEELFHNTLAFSMNDPLYVETLGITHPFPGYRIERCRTGVRRFGIYVFEAVLSGTGYIECEGIKYSVSAGDFYFLNNNCSHIYYADREHPFEKIWINVRGKLITKLLEAYDITAPVIVLHSDFSPMIHEIHNIYSSPTEESLDERNYRAAQVFSAMILRMDREVRGNEVKVDLPLRLKLFIDNRMDFTLSVEQLARQFHLNSNYITAVFKRKYGTTPKQYMLERKIECAKQLLQNRNCEIKEIAATLAFSSVYHFSNTFKRLTGMTPTEYRRESPQYSE
ncbi:MAG: AraC family transcriptional regulator [Eubacteriales bacterium]|nr:AraC family transcriptional regulator [Eubacteriales bacterium]